jgi:hypothetical protein
MKPRRSLGHGSFWRRTGKTRIRMREIELYSWDVRTLYRAGALKTLTDEIDRYDVDILAIQEMIWTGGGIIEKKKNILSSIVANRKNTHWEWAFWLITA